MISDPKKQFAVALAYMLDIHPRGTQMKMARKTGIRQGVISDIARGKKGCIEQKRRVIAAFFGYDYESFLKIGGSLIDTGNPNHIAEIEADYGVKEPKMPKKQDTDGLIKMTREILESQTAYADSLAANVRAFHQAINVERKVEKLEEENKDMNIKIDTLHRELALLKSSAQELIHAPGADDCKEPRQRKARANT